MAVDTDARDWSTPTTEHNNQTPTYSDVSVYGAVGSSSVARLIHDSKVAPTTKLPLLLSGLNTFRAQNHAIDKTTTKLM